MCFTYVKWTLVLLRFMSNTVLMRKDIYYKALYAALYKTLFAVTDNSDNTKDKYKLVR